MNTGYSSINSAYEIVRPARINKYYNIEKLAHRSRYRTHGCLYKTYTDSRYFCLYKYIYQVSKIAFLFIDFLIVLCYYKWNL